MVKFRVMIVDDDSDIPARGEFMPLEDPVQAIQDIARFQPDVVICPIAIPGWDGLQLVGMLRGNPRLAHIQVELPVGRRGTIIYRRTIGKDSTSWAAQPF